jgi:ABC-2 type transport system ATP-binding protein
MIEEGVSVLWATHLIDEVMQEDDIVVLHHGRVLAHGTAAHVVKAADAPDIGSAFMRLTQTMEARHEIS